MARTFTATNSNDGLYDFFKHVTQIILSLLRLCSICDIQITEQAALSKEKNRKTCLSARWSTTNPSCTGMELNLGLCNDSLSTNCLSHGTAHLYHLQYTQYQLAAHTRNPHITLVLWTVHCLDYILYTQQTGKVLYSMVANILTDINRHE